MVAALGNLEEEALARVSIGTDFGWAVPAGTALCVLLGYGLHGDITEVTHGMVAPRHTVIASAGSLAAALGAAPTSTRHDHDTARSLQSRSKAETNTQTHTHTHTKKGK